MEDGFIDMLAVGGKSNSLGKVDKVIDIVLHDKSRLEELYDCMFAEDPWTRMRAADAFEKVCRQRPDWILPFVDRFPNDLAVSTQPSILWHLAQIYAQVDLTGTQKSFAINWLKNLLSSKDIDWIVSSNAMDTLVKFTKEGSFAADDMATLLKVQQGHKSKAINKRATKLLAGLD